MITNKDLSVINLSPTKKDFYQIWNELLDVAKKLSERWDPTSTNESDPGIVLLKVLTAIADKLNYNIDKNILEAFMPSAAQEESMRKLCEMMGYNIKYYQSAVTKVRFTYTGLLPEDDNSINVSIRRFANITNIDKDINYVVIGDENGDSSPSITLEINQYTQVLSRTLTCIEGELVQCETNNDNIISSSQLDDRHRYYLPENQIAENGIFVYNIDDYGEIDNSKLWEKVDNLNTAAIGEPVFKFGYDSREARPYIQFPDDVNYLIKNGLKIFYIRTSGVNGNIAARTLSTFANFDEDVNATSTDTNITLDENSFIVTNETATFNGANIETITQAYEGFKKIVGTFDTLVTCRDYMNKIYTLMDGDNIPLVSNCIVSDIRDDINRSITLCTFNDYGISYNDEPRKIVDNGKYKDKINHFNLILYPFKKITGLNNYNEYIESFKSDLSTMDEITSELSRYKTIAHIISSWAENEGNDDNILCIKNYLKLNARITTINKVNVAEQADILANIKNAIYKSFNMRQLDFGEEIPFESILSCINSADTRIKNVALDEPIIDTRFLVYDNEGKDSEYSSSETEAARILKFNEIYDTLALRNVLAGRVELFNYDKTFTTAFDEKDTKFYPTGQEKTIKNLKPSFTIDKNNLVSSPLKQNEIIKFRAPNFKTVVTYPAYVRYRYEGATVESDNDHKLGSGENLYIYYIDQNDVPQYKHYKTPSIISPSGFNLAGINEDKSSVKEIAFKDGTGTHEIKMDILGPNEQISIKEKAIVTFNDSRTNLYWILNNKDNSMPLTALTDSENKTTYNYTLQDGEYVFYTDRSKTALAYYGTGTEISFSYDPGQAVKSLPKTVSAEDIINNGIKAIPWRLFNFNTTNYLTIHEYQYRTLTAGDIITSIATTESSIYSSWKKCASAEYTFADTTSDHLPTIADGNWEVRSYLALNAGPNKAQELERNADTITITYTDDSTDEITGPTAFKTSYKCQAIVDVFDASVSRLALTPTITPTPFTIKKFTKDTVVENELINVLHNFSDSVWTKVAVTDFTSSNGVFKSGLKLNTSIPDGHYGLMMFYLSTNNPVNREIAKNMYIEADAGTLGIFNNVANYNESPLIMNWWNGYSSNGKYTLKKGINVVYITPDTKYITIKAEQDTKDTSIIFSDLDLVITKDGNSWGINTTVLGFKKIDTRELDIQILNKINDLVAPTDVFYYNCPMDNTTVININPEAIDQNTDSKENLASPKFWYDYNNINNKFVISEIDADYLDTGIQIANSSKR